MRRLTLVFGCLVAIVVLVQLAETSPPSTGRAAAADSAQQSSQEGEQDESYEEKHSKVDPIEANGPIFVDWPKPVAALLFSGEMDGYLEPCGCTGLENQKGGLKRRHTLIKQLEAQGWPVASFDMGGLVRRVGPQAEIKFRYALESLTTLGYSAVAIGASELQLSPGELFFAVANLDPEANPLTSANVALADFESGLTSRYEIVEVGPRRIGVVAVLGAGHVKQLGNASEIVAIDPAAALEEIAPKIAQANCDHQVLLVHGTPDEAASLAKQFPQFTLVGTTGGAEEPPRRPKRIPGANARLIEVGHKGTYVVVLGLYDDPEHPIRFQKVPLDHRFEDSPAMHEMMVAYQNELKLRGLDGLGLSGTPHPRGQFAGSEACADCHSEATEVFLASHHPHATESLVKADPPRHYDPECLSCHVVGWNPQEYFPYASGYKSLSETPLLTGNGCENCHGPAAEHVAVESGEKDATEAEQEALRAALHLEVLENEGNKHGQRLGRVVDNCLKCHDTDNSPDFDFQEYWNREVKHEGKY